MTAANLNWTRGLARIYVVLWILWAAVCAIAAKSIWDEQVRNDSSLMEFARLLPNGALQAVTRDVALRPLRDYELRSME